MTDWDGDLAVGLTGAFLMCFVVGPVMADRGAASSSTSRRIFAIIAPDQRLYRRDGVDESQAAGEARHLLGGQGGSGRPDALSGNLLGRTATSVAMRSRPAASMPARTMYFLERIGKLIPLSAGWRIAMKSTRRLLSSWSPTHRAT